MLQIKLASIFVDDQAKALRFYTETLGFMLRTDAPAGEFRWITVGSSAESSIELVLEPNAHAAARAFQAALYEQGIPATALFTEDMAAEYERLTALGVRFQNEPVEIPGGPRLAVLDDTCGNWIQLVEG